MARKSRKRRSFNLRRVRPTPSLALTTLAASTAKSAGLTGASTSTYRAVSTNMIWIAELLQEGPVIVGLAHSDYSVTEIKECIESAGSIDAGDKIAQEKANRLVRMVGTLGVDEDTLNDGKPIKTRLNWLISIGDEVNVFAYNDSGAVLTTGAIVHVTGDLWVKDSV